MNVTLEPSNCELTLVTLQITNINFWLDFDWLVCFQCFNLTKYYVGCSCGSGLEPASCYQKVVDSILLVCMLKCPWYRYWTWNCSWCSGGHHRHQCMHVWITVSCFGPKRLLNETKYYCGRQFRQARWCSPKKLPPGLQEHAPPFLPKA